MKSVEILICTIGEGIGKVPYVLMEKKLDKVSYLVSWQTMGYTATPAALICRDDVRVVKHNTIGLSANRNFAIEHAKADLLVISDDDTRYEPSYIDNIRNAFENNSEADIIVFQALDYSGRPIKNYSSNSFTYRQRPRFTYFSSVEMVINRNSRIPAFDSRFGLGSKELSCGEEDIFLHDSSCRGLTIVYVPKPIVKTSGNTTGRNVWVSKKVQRSKGAVWGYMFGIVPSLLRCAKFAISPHPVGMRQRIEALYNMAWGVFYIKSSLNGNGKQ